MNLKRLQDLVKEGEGPSLEFKRTTGELREGLEAVCGMLNGKGGRVLFGVNRKGVVEGQQVSEQTIHEITDAFRRFEPPPAIGIERVKLRGMREVIVLAARPDAGSVPYAFDGRPFERVGNTTRKMSQARYEALLIHRTHDRQRWENQPDDDLTPADIDREEVFRIVEIARSVGRLAGPVGRGLPDVLDRLGVRKQGKILRAAVVLFGRTFLPDYPQCELRMARFKGTDNAEFLDQRQIRGPAFNLLEEAEMFCQRHFPLPAKIVPGRMQRVETPLIPPDAMREILVNALIHRDYSIAGGAVSLAIYDDRVEVWSAGRFPVGITAEALSKKHQSVQRNPIIAEVFNRAGLIEKWGRGTNRVIDMCRKAGVAEPMFEEVTGAAVVTFHVKVRATEQVTTQVTGEVAGEVTGEVARLLKALSSPLTRSEIQASLRLRSQANFRDRYLRPVLETGLVEMMIPDKPNSRFQKYRLTDKGRAWMKTRQRT